MRKSLLIFLIIGGMALGFGMFNNMFTPGQINPANLQASTANDSQNTLGVFDALITYKDPISFSMPSLGLNNIAVESVGLDKESKMDVPKDADNVGWYNLGFKPGEKGNVVMAGHLDKKTGETAVFYNISKLKPGDDLVVKDEDGREFTYEVTETKTYELSKFPLEEVFGAGNKARLNLITCEGTFDKSSKLYSHRLVVYSELKS